MRQRARSLALVLALVLALCACGGGGAPGWEEQYDLGVRYLSEGNYQEAVIAFTAAIEIEPKKTELYIGLADAYIGQDDSGRAAQVLLDALETVEDPEAIRTYMNEQGLPARTEREDGPDGSYWIISYLFNGRHWGTQYGPDGTVLGTRQYVYQPDGSCDVWEYGPTGLPRSCTYPLQNQEGGYGVDTYDELGRRISEILYVNGSEPAMWLGYDYDGASVTIHYGSWVSVSPYVMAAADHSVEYQRANEADDPHLLIDERDAAGTLVVQGARVDIQRVR